MHLTKLFCAAVLVAGMIAALPGTGSAGSITVDGATGRNNYLGSLNTMVSGLTSLSQFYLDRQGTPTTGIELIYNPGEDVANVSGTEGYTLADADWARANLRIYDIYQQLGGNSINLAQQYRRVGSQFYVGLDGSGGRWFTDLASAQGYMFKLLVGASAEIPAAVKASLVGFSSDDLTSVVDQARDAMLEGRGILAHGTSTSITLNGEGYSNASGTPFLLGPDGVTFENVAFVDSSQITATVKTSASTATGLTKIFVYNLGSTMLPVDSFDVLIVSGSGTLVADADDHGDTTVAATAIAAASTTLGRISSTSDNDVFQVVLGAAGTLQVSSSGPTDVDVSLENAGGTSIGSDSDGGQWYNFNLSQSLAAGTYFVRVSHCCGGLGDYSLTASFAAN